ncbi:MAG: glycosyltransferase family 2 protein [Planctomycetota bacterium]|jgi:glycosyltransferase involved in cell wall biosynthesis
MTSTQPLAWQQEEVPALHKVEIPPVLIVIPALNEEATIREVIEDLLDTELNLHVLVINDGSEDRTESIVRDIMETTDRVFLLSLPNNIGIGGAVQAGFKFAARNGYPMVIQVDGDGQHRADQLDKLIDPLKEGKADIIIGSRFLVNNGFSSSFFRKVGIKFFTMLISLLTARPVTDPTSGFRAYSRNSIEYLADNYAEDYPEPESIIILHRRRFSFMEVPVRMNSRAGGKSSISPMKSTYYMIKVTIAILIDLFRRVGMKK